MSKPLGRQAAITQAWIALGDEEGRGVEDADNHVVKHAHCKACSLQGAGCTTMG